MANWLTFKRASEKYDVAECILRQWQIGGYITFSTIGEVVMLEETSLVQYVNVYKAEAALENSFARLIREKEQEIQTILSTLDDEFFLLKTRRCSQPLFRLLVKELSYLVSDECKRDIFFALSCGESISRVAQRYGMSYDAIVEIYESVFNELGANPERIPMYRQLVMARFRVSDNPHNPLDIPLKKILGERIARIFDEEKDITTVQELVTFGCRHGWKRVEHVPRIGLRTFQILVETLKEAHYIIVGNDGQIDLSP